MTTKPQPNEFDDNRTVIPDRQSHADSVDSNGLQETFIASADTPPKPNEATQLETSSKSADSFSQYEFLKPGPSKSQSSVGTLKSIGEYDVTGILGRGGMGVVYRGTHRTLKRDVAIKMMLAGSHASDEQAQRFLVEARAVAHLQHPNIVQIFEVGESEGTPYFTLEYVTGQSLDVHLRNRTLSERDAARLIQTLCLTLQYAHDQGILHRDLKPANVLMTEDGRPKVTDFGLARRIEDSDDSSKTKDGTIMGTPSYMSPEQARGDVNRLTPATDQYSLGAMLYEMLTGRPPFKGARPVDTVLLVINNEPVALRELQPKLSIDLETICLKAMQKDVAKRYSSCTTMADDLGRFLRSEPILARPVGRGERLWRWCRRNPIVASLSALAFGALFAVAGVSSWSAIRLNAAAVELTKKNVTLESQSTQLRESAVELGQKNETLEARTMRLQEFVQSMYDELRQFNVDETPRIKPARDRLLSSFNDIMLQVVDELPKEGNSEPVYAAVKMGLVESLIDQQKTDEAEKILEELREIFERRVSLKQGSDAARNNLVLLISKVGNLKRNLRRDLQASLAAHESALKIAQDIVDHPKAAADGKGLLPVYLTRTLLADTHTDLGATWYRLGDPQQALTHLELALSLRQQAIRDFELDTEVATWPDEDKSAERDYLLSDLQFKKLGTGAAFFRAGRFSDAEPLLKEVYSQSRTALDADPSNPRLRNDYVGEAGLWAEFLGFSGRGEEALAVLELAGKHIDQLLADDPAGVTFRRTASVALYRLSQWRKELQQGDADAPLSQCLEIRQTLASNEPHNDRRQLDLMLALARSGRADETIAIAERYLKSPNPDTEMLIEIARSLAQASLAEGSGSPRTSIQAQAMNALQLARQEGFRDAVFLNGEPDLKPLNELTEFKELIAGIADVKL